MGQGVQEDPGDPKHEIARQKRKLPGHEMLIGEVKELERKQYFAVEIVGHEKPLGSGDISYLITLGVCYRGLHTKKTNEKVFKISDPPFMDGVREGYELIMGKGFTCQDCKANYNWKFNYCPDCGRKHGGDKDLYPMIKDPHCTCPGRHMIVIQRKIFCKSCGKPIHTAEEGQG